MLKIKKGDMVQAVKGKDSGKQGKVIYVLATKNMALVEGINTVKKAKRRTQQDQQGGIVTIETPIRLANLMLVCKECKKPVRVGFKFNNDKTKIRFCKSCKEAI